MWREGCLSVPEFYDEVERPKGASECHLALSAASRRISELEETVGLVRAAQDNRVRACRLNGFQVLSKQFQSFPVICFIAVVRAITQANDPKAAVKHLQELMRAYGSQGN